MTTSILERYYQLVDIVFNLSCSKRVNVREVNVITPERRTDINTAPGIITLLQYLTNLLCKVFVFPFLILRGIKREFTTTNYGCIPRRTWIPWMRLQ